MNSVVKDNLSATRSNLIKKITLLSYDQFNSKPDLNMWSIAQVCQHLVLVEKASIKAIAWGLKEIGSTQIERKDIHHIMMDRTSKIKAPKIVEPDVESFEVQQIIILLTNSRKELMAFLSTIEDKSILTQKSLKHPALGELLLDQWIEQIYLHEQRHIEQIKEIRLRLEASH